MRFACASLVALDLGDYSFAAEAVMGHRMLEVEESVTDRALLQRAGCGDLVAAGSLYDRYGAALYALAITVTNSRSAARAAVVDGFRTAAASNSEPGDRIWQLLARATFAACPKAHGRQVQSRCLLALTCFGAHNYREAALILGLEPGEAARCIRDALRGPTAPDL